MNFMKHVYFMVLCIINTQSACTDNNFEFNTFVIIIPSYNNAKYYKWNLDSVLNQDCERYRIIYIDDNSTDGTGDLVEKYVAQHPNKSKVTILRNTERKGALENLYHAIHSCLPHEIIVTVDGDDALIDNTVLLQLDKIYTPDIWMTYGQFYWYPSYDLGCAAQVPEHIITSNTLRTGLLGPWCMTHLRTFRAGLFCKIIEKDLKYKGEFFDMAWDVAIMLPMAEMAGHKHARFVDVPLYLYNYSNPLCDHAIGRDRQVYLDNVIRKRPAYKPLEYLY